LSIGPRHCGQFFALTSFSETSRHKGKTIKTIVNFRHTISSVNEISKIVINGIEGQEGKSICGDQDMQRSQRIWNGSLSMTRFFL
jgi:hypothetical protein